MHRPLRSSLIGIVSATFVMVASPLYAQDNTQTAADDPFGPVESPIAAELPPTEDDDIIVDDEFQKPPLAALQWLQEGEASLTSLTSVPPIDVAPNISALTELGRVAFRSPALLGGYAAELGISCNSCHTSGATQRQFYLPPLSKKPGSVDITNALFATDGEDNKNNPQKITNLVLASANYPTRTSFENISAFIRKKIVEQLGGTEPDPLIVDGLTFYIFALSENTKTNIKPIQERHRFDGPDKLLVRLMNDEIARTFAVLDKALEEQEAAVATFVVASAKAAIGRLFERLDEQDPARPGLIANAMSLDTVTQEIERQNWPAARLTASRIKSFLLAESNPIESRADLTYFNKAWLEGALDPEKRILLEGEEEDVINDETAAADQIDQ